MKTEYLGRHIDIPVLLAPAAEPIGRSSIMTSFNFKFYQETPKSPTLIAKIHASSDTISTPGAIPLTIVISWSLGTTQKDTIPTLA